jgi:hypothetical protein
VGNDMSEHMRTDFENLPDGSVITLHPNDANPLHKEPVKATYSQGYFYCEGTNPMDGPDYYFRDVLQYNSGFTSSCPECGRPAATEDCERDDCGVMQPAYRQEPR